MSWPTSLFSIIMCIFVQNTDFLPVIFVHIDIFSDFFYAISIKKKRGNKMQKKQLAYQAIEKNSDALCSLSDAIWDHPEVGYHEEFAANAYCDFLEHQGFTVTRNLAQIKTAFCGSYGFGSPVIGILGEFDALPGLSQKAETAKKEAVVPDGPGHGCGHNLLGVGSLAAALAVKSYLEQGHEGTVIFYGCPAEEGGAGKAFMARDGVFDGLDLAFSWHPGDFNSVSTDSNLANYQVCYSFSGISSHAGISPDLGRSALDAAELMNVGVQFLREHVKPDIRIHYAFTDVGGESPGVVQSHAKVLYLMRAPGLPQVRSVYERVNKIARGAAMMTETEVDIQFVKACSNVLPNRTLCEVLQKNMEELGPLVFSDEDMALAKRIQDTIQAKDDYFTELAAQIADPKLRAEVLADADSPLHGLVMPLCPVEEVSPASSDVGDVSWVCPVAQITTATMPGGTPMHSWQEVSVGKSGMAHKGMLYAGKVLAGAAIDVFENPEIVRKAKDELNVRTKGEKYIPPIPQGVKPPVR